MSRPSVTRRALLSLFRRIGSIYFRETEVVGNVPSPKTGGRIFAANHVNGLVDPILVLTNAPCPIAPVGKSTLWKIPVLKWLLHAVDAVPVTRRGDDRGNDDKKRAEQNDEVFDRIAAHLGGGGNVLIFPEGKSHSEPRLAPLKSGAGRMLARAQAAGGKGLTFQAVGLEFDAREIFRSRALVVYGPVRSVDDLALSGEELVKAITERLREDLSELIVEGESWDDRLLIARVAELFANDAADRSLAGWNEIGRQVEAARKALGPEHAAIYSEVAAAVSEYFGDLERAGITDADVAAQGASAGRSGRAERLRRRALLALALPLAIPGALLYWLPYQVPRLVAKRVAGKEHDELSTYKLATGLVVFPLWAGALVSASFVFLPFPLSLASSAIVVTSPFAALAWLDHLEHAPPGRRRGAPIDRRALTARRRELVALVDRARKSTATRRDAAE